MAIESASGRVGSRIVVEGVSQGFRTKDREIVALHDVSLVAAPGEFVSLLGPSGCGKSTLLAAIAGLGPYGSGTITIDGRPVRAPQTQLGMVFQEPFLLEWRSVLQNVLLQAEMRGRVDAAAQTRARALIARFGLDGFIDRLPHELSGGMRQRAAICRALLHAPPLLLMDEPFGALDALTRDDLNLELQDMWLRMPTTIVFVTHGISEAVMLSDRVAVMTPRPGRIAEIIDIDLPRPRSLAMRETLQFGHYTRTIRDLFSSLGLVRADSDVSFAPVGG